MRRRLRIAQVAPPLEPVPPRAYGGTERIVYELATELNRRGHDVTTFASGDSEPPGKHVVTAPRALRPAGFGGDSSGYFLATILAVLERADDFDVIHSHVEWYSGILARAAPVPVVSTFHGRLDLPWARDVLQSAHGDYVAISHAQAATHPDIAWAGVVHNGLTLDRSPFERRRGEDLCFVGRVAPEKGIVEAMEIARAAGRRLRIAAKIGTTPHERGYYDDVFRPALDAAGPTIEYLGEIDRADRDRLLAESYASLMPGAWPEPFGLVAIESLACGTPILARRVGALPEIIRDGVDGFFGDDSAQIAFLVDRVAGLDREAIRASVLDRFSAARMTDAYEVIYDRLLAGERAAVPVMAELASAGASPPPTSTIPEPVLRALGVGTDHSAGSTSPRFGPGGRGERAWLPPRRSVSSPRSGRRPDATSGSRPKD